jgi:hypothetical protein
VVPAIGFSLDTTQTPQVLSVSFVGGQNGKFVFECMLITREQRRTVVLSLQCYSGATTPAVQSDTESGSPASYVSLHDL